MAELSEMVEVLKHELEEREELIVTLRERLDTVTLERDQIESALLSFGIVRETVDELDDDEDAPAVEASDESDEDLEDEPAEVTSIGDGDHSHEPAYFVWCGELQGPDYHGNKRVTEFCSCGVFRETYRGSSSDWQTDPDELQSLVQVLLHEKYGLPVSAASDLVTAHTEIFGDAVPPADIANKLMASHRRTAA